MSVTIHHAELDTAIDAITALASDLRTSRSACVTGAPIELTSLGRHALTNLPLWLEDQTPMLEQLSAIAKLLDEDGNGQATFDVGPLPSDVEELLGETLAEKGQGLNPNAREDFTEFTDLLGEWTDDPEVMASFYETLGAEGTLRLLNSAGYPDMVGGDDYATLEERQSLVDALQDGLESATTDPGFDSDGFASGLVDAATVDPEDIMGRGPYNPSGALAVLLHDGDFGREFLETIATDLDQYERVEMDGASGLWGTRPDNGVQLADFLPHGTAMTSYNLDPMTSLMSAMENDPEYALEFFSDDSHAEGQHHRAYYYIHDRTWAQDGFQAITGVLDAATTDPSLLRDPTSSQAEDAAFLASRTIEYFSERHDIDDLPAEFARVASFGQDDPSQNLAHIMSTYMPAVDAALDPTQAGADVDPGVSHQILDGTGGTGEGNMPVFDRSSLDKYSLLAMASDDGFAEVRAGTADYRERYLTAAVNTYANDPDSRANQELLESALEADARREGYFVRQIGEQDIAEGAAADARVQAWIDFGGDVVDLVPIPGVSKLDGLAEDVVNAAIDRGKGAGTEAITDALTNNESQARTDAEGAANATLEQQSYAVATLLAERGLAGDADLEIPSWAEYQELSDAERRDLWTVLNSQTDGVGTHFDSGDYSDTFQSEMASYFYDE